MIQQPKKMSSGYWWESHPKDKAALNMEIHVDWFWKYVVHRMQYANSFIKSTLLTLYL